MKDLLPLDITMSKSVCFRCFISWQPPILTFVNRLTYIQLPLGKQAQSWVRSCCRNTLVGRRKRVQTREAGRPYVSHVSPSSTSVIHNLASRRNARPDGVGCEASHFHARLQPHRCTYLDTMSVGRSRDRCAVDEEHTQELDLVKWSLPQ